MVDKKLSEFSQIDPAEIAKLICLFLDENNAIKNGVVDFATLDALLMHKSGAETITGNKTFSGDAVFSGNATFNQTVNANVSGSSGSCTGNSATATKATQDGSGNNIVDTYSTKTESNGKVDLDAANLSTAGKSLISGIGMPSSTYEDISVGSSESSHDATASGYIYLKTSNTTSWLGIGVYSGNDHTDWDYYIDNVIANTKKTLIVPVKKGMKYFIGYSSGTSFEKARFIYAEGEV